MFVAPAADAASKQKEASPLAPAAVSSSTSSYIPTPKTDPPAHSQTTNPARPPVDDTQEDNDYDSDDTSKMKNAFSV